MGRGRDGGPGTVAFACCAFVWVFVSIFLLAFSFDTLDPNTMGLMYNQNTLFLDKSTLYNGDPSDSGRFYTGLGQGFLEFPRSLISVKFNAEADADGGTVAAKTKQGTTINMGISFQFGIVRDANSVYDMYMKFGDKYTDFLIKSARQIVRDVVGNHSVVDLWEQRPAIGRRMKATLSQQFHDRQVYVQGFQLLSLDIPKSIQNAIENTTVNFQKIGEAEFEKAAQTVKANTKRLVAEKSAEATILRAQGEVGALQLSVQAEAKALNITVSAEASSYSNVKSTFGFNTTELLRYIWLDNVLSSTAGSSVVSISQPSKTRTL